jgi:radical SAM-linked protein
MWYTKGFNPHAKLVFGMPLSVGTESVCEMADLKIERKISLEDIKNQLNEQLTDEMYVTDVYYPTTKFADIAYADYTITLKSEKITKETAELTDKLFSAPIMMIKRSKSGEKEVDITSFIKSIDFVADDGKLTVNAVLSAGSTENLNPEYVVTAIKGLCDFADLTYTIMRNKVYDKYLIEFK